MSVVVRLHKFNNGLVSLRFICPGCHCMHAIWVAGEGVPVWQWNQNMEAPTITPSILCRAPQRDEQGAYVINDGVCHSFIKDGQIQFLDDCTHPLKGKAVALFPVVDTKA